MANPVCDFELLRWPLTLFFLQGDSKAIWLLSNGRCLPAGRTHGRRCRWCASKLIVIQCHSLSKALLSSLLQKYQVSSLIAPSPFGGVVGVEVIRCPPSGRKLGVDGLDPPSQDDKGSGYWSRSPSRSAKFKRLAWTKQAAWPLGGGLVGAWWALGGRLASDLENNLEKRPLWPLGDASASRAAGASNREKPPATEASNGRGAHGRPCCPHPVVHNVSIV